MIIGFFLLGLSVPEAGAQYYFGKNKVQYARFDWQVMKTTHFDVYFYPEEQEVAEIGAAMAEESYALLETKFAHTVLRRIPLIFYSSPILFEQTNTTPFLLPENVGGFMEFVKGRVVIPHNGSFPDFRRVIRHELAHVFMYDKIAAILRQHGIYRIYVPPLWFSEGLAEYWSRGWDPQADMILKDAVFSEQLVPIQRMYEINGSFKMYKEGQSIVQFIAETYGEDVLTLLLENWWRDEDFRRVVQWTIGDDLKKVNTDWHYALKKRYFPQIEEQEGVSRTARVLTRGGMNVKPSVIPRSSEPAFVFLSNRTGYSSIYRQDLDGEEAAQVVQGERTADFESFHFLGSKLDVSDDGRLAFVSKSRGRDALYVWDLTLEEPVGKFVFPKLVSLSSPSWSPDGRRVVLSGLRWSGRSDLYVVDTRDGGLTPLTDDLYDDRDPDWSPDGKQIVFSSDRGVDGEQGWYNLFVYDLDTCTMVPVTYGAAMDRTPAWSPDGRWIAFSSNREGAFDLYVTDREGGPMVSVTHWITGGFDPVWLLDGKTLLFTGFEGYTFQIYRLDLPERMGDLLAESSVPPTSSAPPQRSEGAEGQGGWLPKRVEQDVVRSAVRYDRKFGLDVAQSQVINDPELGVSGGIQLAMTDMLGDYQYYMLVSNSAGSKDDFFKNFNIAVTRVDLSWRMNTACGIFHLSDRHFNTYDQLFRERRYGGFVAATYPFSKFRRVESSLVARFSDKRWLDWDRQRKAFLISHFIGYTEDTALWGSIGPIDGHRYTVALGYTVEPRWERWLYATALLDYRMYRRLSQRTTLALRLLGRSSTGREAQRFYMGGSWTFRGYPRGSLWGRKLVLWNTELRFPLIDALWIGFPFGGIGFGAIRGAVFLDVGNAWETQYTGLLGSFGAGVRVRVSDLLVLRLDLAKRTDFHRISRRTYREFFFGWDF